MIPRTTDTIEKGRIDSPLNQKLRGTPYGSFVLKSPYGSHLVCIAAAGGDDWPLPLPAFDHVSVSVQGARRCPTWDEMNWVKDVFWLSDELVIQYHPPKATYVNLHPFVLHLWRPVGVEIPLPPPECV